MIFKRNYVFIDIIDKEKIRILRNFSLRKKYYIEFLNLTNNKKDFALREDLLYFINTGKLKFLEVLK